MTNALAYSVSSSGTEKNSFTALPPVVFADFRLSSEETGGGRSKNGFQKWREKRWGKVFSGSAKTNGKEPQSSSGKAFNFKLGCFAVAQVEYVIHGHSLLEWKPRHLFCLV